MRWQLLPAAFLGSSGATQEPTDRRCAACTRNKSVSFSALSPYLRSAAEPEGTIICKVGTTPSTSTWRSRRPWRKRKAIHEFDRSRTEDERTRQTRLKWRPFPAFPTGGWIADLQVYSLTGGAFSSHVFWEYMQNTVHS